MKKFMLRAIPVLFVAVLIIGNYVFAANATNGLPLNGTASNTASKLVGRIWGTVFMILRVLAVGAIVFAGVKYMFASAESKADIKGGLIGLVIGAILVFGATFLVEIISNTAEDLSKTA